MLSHLASETRAKALVGFVSSYWVTPTVCSSLSSLQRLSEPHAFKAEYLHYCLPEGWPPVPFHLRRLSPQLPITTPLREVTTSPRSVGHLYSVGVLVAQQVLPKPSCQSELAGTDVLLKLLPLAQLTEAAEMAVYREQLSHRQLGQVAEAGLGSHPLSWHSHSQQSYEPALKTLSRKDLSPCPP